MKRLLLFVILTANLVAQTDVPPELEEPLAPEDLPVLDAPQPPLGQGKLTLEFEGISAFPKRTLREGIALQAASIEEFGLDDPGAYDAAYGLESYYRKHGYSVAEVTPTIVGPWVLRLEVIEGPVTQLGTVEIVGNRGYDTETLKEFLLGPLRERYPRVRLESELPFVEVDIYEGVALVRRLYATGGYLDAIVDGPQISVNADGTLADVSITIEEGTQFRFGEIQFLGETIFARNELLEIVAEHTTDIFTDGRLNAARRAMEDFYVRRGYFKVSVAVESDLASAVEGRVPVQFVVAPGQIFRFDGVSVEGNEGVTTAFIEKRMRRLSGKVYDPALVDKSFRTLIRTGLFRNLRITPEAAAGGQVRLLVSVEESKSKEFGLGLGYATFYGGIVSASYGNLNLFGTGRPLRMEVEANQRGFTGEVLYTDPWLFDTDYELRLRLYGVSETLKGYAKNEIGFQPSISRLLTEAWQVSGFAIGKNVSINNVDIRPASLVGLENYSVFSIGISQTLDFRNNPVLPTKGVLFSTSFDVAPNGVGEVAFARGSANFSWYIPITEKSTLALGARAGVISPLNSEGIPIAERFFSGGATTVRSFSELTLGPRDRGGYPLGGQARTVFNAEYTFPIYGDLYGAVFVDAGNVIADASDFGIEEMRYAIGGGLRYNLPIGAIRFDYGLNPSPRQGEAQGAFHFAIGVAF